MASNIANFIKSNKLDGVDIDWEYPGAPDIPGIPAASTSDGANYLAFLVVLKNLLSGKSLSIAAPASYWYLKGFPIKDMAPIVDYIVYMTYDLHGQWDFNNKWSDPGCPGGNCLRSDVNLTETINALVMITKAGVPSNKVIVGVTSYGRAYGMTTPGCWTEMCTFGGTAADSTAEKGPCTGVGGYISDAEIKDIASSTNRGATKYFDSKSQTDILVWGSNNWVGYMSPSTKASRVSLYKSLGMGGVTDWAVDLENELPPPAGTASTWKIFIDRVNTGGDPYLGTRTGNWTSLTCDEPAAKDDLYTEAAVRWAELDCDDAWANAIDHWKTVDRPDNQPFLNSLQFSLKTVEGAQCGVMSPTDNCISFLQCQDIKSDPGESGPAAWLIWNSLINVNNMYLQYYTALFQAATIIDATLGSFNDAFDPVPDNSDGDALIFQIILDLVGLSGMFIAAPFMNNFLSRLPYFIANAAAKDNTKDISYAALATVIAIGKDLLAGQKSTGPWTVQKQNQVSAYFGQVISGWGNTTEQGALALFNGSDSSITQLSKVIGKGHMLPAAKLDGGTAPPAMTQTQLQSIILRSFYAYAIPTAWVLSQRSPVILDTGASCGTDPNSLDHFTRDDVGKVWACYPPNTGRLYMLGWPQGSAEYDGGGECDGCPGNYLPSRLTALPGMDDLANSNNQFGGITLQDIIAGYVITYFYFC